MVSQIIALGWIVLPFISWEGVGDSFTEVKAAWITGVVAVLLLVCGRSSQILIPQLPKGLVMRCFLLIFVMSLIANLVANFASFELSPWMDTIVCGVFLLLMMSECRRSSSWQEWFLQANLGVTGILIGLMFLEWASGGGIASTRFFGQQNLTSEFMGLSFLFQMERLRRTLGWSPASWIILFATVAIMLIFGSRSALLATFVAGFIFLYLTLRGSRAKAWVWGIGIALSCVIFQFYNYSVTKTGNTELRRVRWVNTIEMIRSYPLGVGAGGFEFRYPHFKNAYRNDTEATEQTLIKQPHSGYLQCVAEYGWPLGLSLLALVFLLGYRFRQSHSMGTPVEIAWAVAVLGWIAVDALFAFPLSVPAPSYAFVLALAVILTSLKTRTGGTRKLHPGFMIGIAYLFLTVETLRAGSLVLSSRTQGDQELVRIACQMYPFHWRLCLLQAQGELESDRVDHALITAQKILGRHPDFFPGLKLRAAIYLKAGAFPQACRDLRAYDQIFLGQSSLHDLTLNDCEAASGLYVE